MIGPGRRAAVGAALALGLSCSDVTRAAGENPKAPSSATAPRPKRVAVALDRLQVTEGRLGPGAAGGYRVEAPKLRAVAPSFRRASAALRFTYLGPTETLSPLASGEPRRQLGLKLKARDGCNVVYVMWRLAPVPGVVVQVKENPGLSRSADCGNGGYRTARPLRSRPPPALAPGDTHLLEARLDGTALSVDVDGVSIWEGPVDAAAAALEGPIGVRTDNVRCELELLGEPD